MTRLRNLEPFRSTIKEAWEKFRVILHCYPITVMGPSMFPTFAATPSIFLAERISDQYGKLARGDVVLLRSPQNPAYKIAKRLVGIGGDSIEYVSVIKNQSVACDSCPKYTYKLEKVVVPQGHVWVQGDNIYNSWDSRQFGPVPYGLIEGKIFWRVMPYFGPLEKK